MNYAKLKKIVFRCLHYLLMGTISVIMLLPFSWTLATSMRKASNSFTLPPAIFPTIWDGENYRRVFEELNICKYMANSLIVTLGSLVIMVLVTSMAAYAFSRIEFKGRNVLFPVLLAPANSESPIGSRSGISHRTGGNGVARSVSASIGSQ